MPGRAPLELREYVQALARQSNFDQSGCFLVGEGELDVDGYFVYYRHWAGCGGFPDQTTWDVYGVTESGSAIMSALLVTTAMPETQQRQMVTGWTLDPQALPSGSAYERKGAAEFPLPPWLEVPGSSAETGDQATG